MRKIILLSIAMFICIAIVKGQNQRKFRFGFQVENGITVNDINKDNGFSNAFKHYRLGAIYMNGGINIKPNIYVGARLGCKSLGYGNINIIPYELEFMFQPFKNKRINLGLDLGKAHVLNESDSENDYILGMSLGYIFHMGSKWRFNISIGYSRESYSLVIQDMIFGINKINYKFDADNLFIRFAFYL
ncbi:MAG: hypothetical protein N4A32_05955 [Marinifilaceae bacterium]|jgi:hypothetical protein|nr:hypothetical protein [Marinifilaceae bacterium]